MPRTPVLGRQALLALATLAAALAVACGGGAATPADGGAEAPRTAAAGAADSPIDDPAPPPSVAPGDGSAPPPTPTDALPPAREDGLTGAPVTPPAAVSVDFDEGRLRENAGRFPPLDDPVVVPAAAASWMRPDDLVLGALRGGEARAYPLFMMTFHHVANDTLAGEPYLVTF